MIGTTITEKKLAVLANVLDVLALIVILSLCFIFQFALKELPCPLCLLQRIGFLITGIGFLLNLRFGLRTSHYALSLLGALFTAFVALRQIALHIVPGTGAYGSSILGFHMYTWSFIASMALIAFTSIILGFDAQYRASVPNLKSLKWIMHVLIAVMLVLALSNFIAVLGECGLSQCPDNPAQYL